MSGTANQRRILLNLIQEAATQGQLQHPDDWGEALSQLHAEANRRSGMNERLTDARRTRYLLAVREATATAPKSRRTNDHTVDVSEYVSIPATDSVGSLLLLARTHAPLVKPRGRNGGRRPTGKIATLNIRVTPELKAAMDARAQELGITATLLWEQAAQALLGQVEATP